MRITTPYLFIILAGILFGACGEKENTQKTVDVQPSTAKPALVNVVQHFDTTFETDGRSVKQVKQKYENDTLFREWNYSNGQLNGESYSYHPDGKPFSMHTYMHGKKNGPYKTWHTNGMLYMEGQWEDDKPAGIWKFYNEKGELVSERDVTRDPIQLQPDTLKP